MVIVLGGLVVVVVEDFAGCRWANWSLIEDGDSGNSASG